MKIVAMLTRCDGNAEVGSMWTETKIFDSTATLDDVMFWATLKMAPSYFTRGHYDDEDQHDQLCERLTLQFCEE